MCYTLAMCGASCAGSMCCAVCDGIGKTGAVASQIPYLILMFLGGLFAIIMREFGTNDMLEGFDYYDATVCNTDSCKANGTAFRVSFISLLFHLFHFVVLWIPMVPIAVHTSCFLVKLAFYAGLLTWSFWWDNDMFDDYADASRFFSFVFLLYLAALVIYWASDVEIQMRKKMGMGQAEEQHSQCAAWTFLFVIFILFAGSMTLNILFFGWYGGDGCERNTFLIVVTLICGVFSFFGSFPGLTGSGFFLGSTVSLYCTWLLYSGLSSLNDPQCNVAVDEGETASDNTPASVWLGLIFLCMIMTYTPPMYENLQEEREDIEKQEEENGETEASKEQKENLEEREKGAAARFHLVMCFASMYLAMVLTNWGYQQDSFNDSDVANLWINAIAQWITFGLYLYLLIAGCSGGGLRLHEEIENNNSRSQELTTSTNSDKEEDEAEKSAV